MHLSHELLNEHEAARRLGLSVATLRRRRLLREPPRYVKLGARVVYRPQDLDAFVEANTIEVGPTGEQKPFSGSGRR